MTQDSPLNIVVAQLDYTVGDLDGNTRRILEVIDGHGETADLIVFSELAVTGYYPYDLLERASFLEAQDQCIERIQAATRDRRAAVALGHVRRNGSERKRLRNSLSVLHRGERVFRYDKTLLPTYDVFDEDRHFAAGALDAPRVWAFNGRRIGFLICEDAWTEGYAKNPVAALADEHPDLVVHINASPAGIGKAAERERIIAGHVARLNAPWIYVNQVGATDELVYDGAGFVCDPAGGVVDRLPCYEATVREVTLGQGDQSFDEGSLPQMELIRRHLELGLKDYVAKCNFPGVVVGLSGGIDSALTVALAAEALGPDRVTAVTMPGPYSSTGSVDDSQALCDNLGLALYHAPIEDGYAAVRETFRGTFGQGPAGVADENLQARLRGLLIMACSNQFGALVLSTGNKSELAVGYATLYGDMAGGLNLLGDLYKTEVYALAKYLNERAGYAMIPQAILDKVPSAELAPGQSDSDSLPPYPLLDAILKLYIEDNQLPESEYQACRQRLRGTPADVVKRVLNLVDRAEFKRRQAAPVIRLRPRAFGDGRRLPVARGYGGLDLEAVFRAV